jgi:hypothetical protein
MRSTIIALTAVLLAPGAAIASVASGDLVGNGKLGAAGAAVQEPQTAPGGDAAARQRGSSGGNIILAKGDQSGKGPGAGGQKGQKKGGHKGKQAEGKDNPGKGQGQGRK